MTPSQYLARLVVFVLLLPLDAAANSVNVAVASNMSHAISEIAKSFEREEGIRPRLSFGSSGNFTRQLIQGAPFKVFLSADDKYIDILRDNHVSMLESVTIARGRIALFVPARSSLAGLNNLSAVVRDLQHGNYSRIVIANPEHAPYGIAARQAMQTAGLWAIERQRLLLAENAAQATQISLSGNVDAGIVPLSHAMLPELAGKGRVFPIPETWHTPLTQHLLLLHGANDSETRFYQFLKSDKALHILEQHGYVVSSLTPKAGTDGLAGP